MVVKTKDPFVAVLAVIRVPAFVFHLCWTSVKFVAQFLFSETMETYLLMDTWSIKTKQDSEENKDHLQDKSCLLKSNMNILWSMKSFYLINIFLFTHFSNFVKYRSFFVGLILFRFQKLYSLSSVSTVFLYRILWD